MEGIYRYIINNKIGDSGFLPFPYRIDVDGIIITLPDYHEYACELRSIKKADYIIHEVSGCSKLRLKAGNNFHCFFWNGVCYSDMKIIT